MEVVMEFMFLAIVLKVLRVLLPWVLAFFITEWLMDTAGVKGTGVFLFGFFLVGFFLREEVLPFIFKDK